MKNALCYRIRTGDSRVHDTGFEVGKPLHATGLEPATFRVGARHVHHCATVAPILIGHKCYTSGPRIPGSYDINLDVLITYSADNQMTWLSE